MSTNPDPSSNALKAAVLPREIGDTIADRNGTHGDPMDNHDHIANLWTAYLGDVLNRPVQGDEVADMMILLKLSRKHVGGMDIDHYRDSMGYAAIAALYVDGYDPEIEDEEIVACGGENEGDEYDDPTWGIDPDDLADAVEYEVLDEQFARREAELKAEDEGNVPEWDEFYLNIRAGGDE